MTTSLSLLPWAVQFASQTNASIHFENILRRAFIDFFFSLVAIQRIIGMINKLIKKITRLSGRLLLGERSSSLRSISPSSSSCWASRAHHCREVHLASPYTRPTTVARRRVLRDPAVFIRNAAVPALCDVQTWTWWWWAWSVRCERSFVHIRLLKSKSKSLSLLLY